MYQQQASGIFVAVEPTEATKDKILNWAESQGIDKPISREELHTTIIWSRVHVPFRLHGVFESPVEIDPETYKIHRLGPEAIVICFDAPKFHEYHMDARRLGAVYDFPQYIPHLSFTYNGNEYSDDFIDSIQLPDFPLVFDRAYTKELDTSRLSFQPEEVNT